MNKQFWLLIFCVISIAFLSISCAQEQYKKMGSTGEETISSQSSNKDSSPALPTQKAIQETSTSGSGASANEIDEISSDKAQEEMEPDVLKSYRSASPQTGGPFSESVEGFELEKEEGNALTDDEPVPGSPAPDGSGGYGGGRLEKSAKETPDGYLSEEKKAKPDKRDISTEPHAQITDEMNWEITDTLSETTASLQEFRIRSQFPEIAFYHPGLVTDESGETGFTFPSPDSISEYLINIHAASKNGGWGFGETTFKTFQPFFIEFRPPSTMHTGDTVVLKAGVFNYTQRLVNVHLSAQLVGGISAVSNTSGESLTVNPGKVREFSFSVSADNAGNASITINAKSDTISDSIRRSIKILPGKPESYVYRSGTISTSGNELSIEIPDKAVVLQDDFHLRVINDPTYGALADMRELENQPHGSLTKALAIWRTAIFVQSRLAESALMDENLESELTRSIDQGWIRLLAFLNEDGFSFFPGTSSDSLADLLVLDSFVSVDAKYIYDKNILDMLTIRAGKILDSEIESITDRLYAACLIAQNGNYGATADGMIRDVLKNEEVKFNTDPLIKSLYIRCSSMIGEEVNIKDIEKEIHKPSTAQNVQTAGLPLSGVNTLTGSNSITGEINLLKALLKQKTSQDDVLKLISEIISEIGPSVFSTTSNPLEKISAIEMIHKSGTAKFDSDNRIEITINGKKIVLDSARSSMDIPISLKSGMNNIILKSTGSEIFYHLYGRYFHDSARKTTDSIKYSFPDKLDSNGTFNAVFAIYENPENLMRETIIRLPLPIGIKPIESPEILARKLGALRVEIKPDEIVLYFGTLPGNLGMERQIPMKSAFTGNFYLKPPSIETVSGYRHASGDGVRIEWL